MMDTDEKLPSPASRTYGIQGGEQAHAHLLVTCHMYSFVHPQWVESWPLYRHLYSIQRKYCVAARFSYQLLSLVWVLSNVWAQFFERRLALTGVKF